MKIFQAGSDIWMVRPVAVVSWEKAHAGRRVRRRSAEIAAIVLRPRMGVSLTGCCWGVNEEASRRGKRVGRFRDAESQMRGWDSRRRKRVSGADWGCDGG